MLDEKGLLERLLLLSDPEITCKRSLLFYVFEGSSSWWVCQSTLLTFFHLQHSHDIFLKLKLFSICFYKDVLISLT